MSRVEFDQNKLEFAIKGALIEATILATKKMLEITPRDPNRMPKDPSQKVTGTLKESIGYERVDDFHYKVGTAMSEESYAGMLEYGTENMPARSFIRKTLDDNKKELERTFYQVTNHLLKR